MTDVLGWRKKFGVMGPSTNTIVQPDFDDLRPAGVTNHYSRIFTPNAQAISNDAFMSGVRVIGANTIDAVRSVMTSSPDYLVLGMSAVTFFDGIEGANRFQASVEEASGLKLSCGSHACASALRAYGGIKRIDFFRLIFPRPMPRSGAISLNAASRSCATLACNVRAGSPSPKLRRKPVETPCVRSTAMMSMRLSRSARTSA